MMKEGLKELIDEKLNACKKTVIMDKQWFYDFFELLYKHQYNGDVDKVVDLVLSEDALKKACDNINWVGFMGVTDKGKGKRLLDFLDGKFEKEGTEYTHQVLDEIFAFAQQEENQSLGFPNILAKYSALKYSEDVKITRRGEEQFKKDPASEEMKICATLGDFDLAHIKFFKDHEESDHLSFVECRTLKGLEGQRLGQKVMQDMFRFTLESFNNHYVLAGNIRNQNTGAQRFYQRYGAELIRDEYSKAGVFYAIFSTDSLEKLADTEDVRPLSLDEYQLRQSKKSAEKI